MRKTIIIVLAAALALVAIVAVVLSSKTTTDRHDPGPAEISANETTTPEEEAPPASILGRVLRTDGHPIEGATVIIQRISDDETSPTEHAADAKGRFRILSLKPGSYRVDAAAADYISPGPAQARGLTIEIPSEDAPPITDLEIVLPEDAAVTGRITARGEPVDGARLSLYYLHADGVDGPLEPFALDGAGVSDKQGSFSLSSIAPGRLRLLVEADGWALAESREVFLTEGESLKDLDIELAPSGSISVSVLDTQGNPVRADLVVKQPGARARKKALPEGGKLVLSGLPVGDVTLEATRDGFIAESVTVSVVAGELSDVDLVMARAGGLMGKVFTREGDPASNVNVEVIDDQQRKRLARTNANGFFQIDRGAGTAWTATALSHTHASSASVELIPGQEARLSLGGSGSIQGRVVTRAGRPVQNYRIAIEEFEVKGPHYHNRNYFGNSSVNNAEGAFSFGPLRPGVYYLRVEPRDFAGVVSSRIIVREGSATDNVTITVEDGGQISGTVRDAATGDVIAGARVELFEPLSSFPTRNVSTDAQGKYTIDGVSPGRRSVRVMARGYMTQVASGVIVPSDGTRMRDITLDRESPEARFSFHGIGATLEKTDAGVKIQKTLEGSPAETFGLKAGDTIVGIDGDDARELRLIDVVSKIRGEEGVPVALEIEREGEGRLEIDVERGRVVVKDDR